MMFNVADLKGWLGVSHPLISVLVIWTLALLLLRVMRKALYTLRTQVASRVDERRDFRRIDTLANVFRYTSNVVIVGLAIMWTLSAVGISITPILATAGVAGIAVGFGAQSLVKDFFSGLFLLIENQVREGDLIEAAGKSGCVERVTLRHIRVRDYDGSVHFIPNGMITAVTNRSRDFAYAVIDINVPRQENPDRIFDLMRETAESLRNDAQYAGVMIDDIDIAGVEKLEDTVISLRCRLKVLPSRQWRVRREFLRRMKYALDRLKDAEASAASPES